MHFLLENQINLIYVHYYQDVYKYIGTSRVKKKKKTLYHKPFFFK